MTALLLVSRGITLSHERYNHPDEAVFFLSTQSLRQSLLGIDDYTPTKAYPEGSYLFYVPFQFLFRFVGDALHIGVDIQMVGRIAAVLYFTLGCILGALVLYYAFEPKPGLLCIYAVFMLFSLFQIELSRYGTCDTITFFLLMAILCSLLLYFRRQKTVFVLLAFLLCGILTATKYPLLYFCVLPICALCMRRRDGGKGAFILKLCGGMLLLFVGFLLFSPSVVRDPSFLIDACRRELDSYITTGNVNGIGTPLDHLLSLFVYHFFYSDCPGAILFIAYGLLLLVRRPVAAGTDESRVKCFFSKVLPIVTLVFLAYNLLIKTLFFRTLYPYFCICILYASYGVYRLALTKRARLAAYLLLAVTALRGAYLLYALAQPSRGYAIEELLTTNPGWSERSGTVLLSGYTISGSITIPEPTQVLSIEELYAPQAPLEFEKNMFLITDPFAHSMAGIRLAPVTDARVLDVKRLWERFLAENEAYYLGTPYPQHYYWLFGYWLHGSTGTHYEFPTNYVYYFPDGLPHP